MGEITDDLIWETYKKHKNKAEVSRELGINRSTVYNALDRIEHQTRKKLGKLDIKSVQREDIDSNIDTSSTQGQLVDKQTIEYGANGEVRRHWVKTSKESKFLKEAAESFVRGLSKDLEPVKKIKLKERKHTDKILTVIPFGDPHIGLYCSEKEVGKEFNLDIAIRELCASFKYLIDKSPATEKCLIANLGDFFHADNMEGTTSRSGHVLDMAGRLPDIYEAGTAAMQFCVEYAAEKFKKVEVINAIGNHDDCLAMCMTVDLRRLYSDNDRINVHPVQQRHYLQHGKVLIGVTHGHNTKDAQLPLIMATEKRKEWGETKFRYFMRGHHHKDDLTAYNGCKVLQFETLAPSDAYAHSHGYLSEGQTMKAMWFHSQYGYQGEVTSCIDMIRELMD